MIKRVTVVVLCALVIAGGAVYLLRPASGVPDGAPTEAAMARAVGDAVMRNIYRGHVPDRSGDIALIPKPYNFMLNNWDLTTLGSADPVLGSTHAGPWSYLTRVPIVVYGAGVPAGQVNETPTDITSLAPSYAELLGVDNFNVAGRPLDAITGSDPEPKAIVTIVVDGGGWNVLEQHPQSWPEMRALMDGGTTYVNADLGSFPSITGALHANLGTGEYPRTHGYPAHVMRDEDGELVDIFLDDADPRYLRSPAVSELWDEINDNKPFIGAVAFEGWHLGMIGSGAFRIGGDRDVAVLWEREAEHWWVNEDHYDLPDYLATADARDLEAYEAELDARDGLDDGLWFGHSPEVLIDPTVRPGTPAFARYTGDAVMEVLERERVGRGDVTDMLWVEMKMPDFAGHQWNMVGPEVADTLYEVDRQIGRMKSYLDESVGEGEYLLVLTADHGQQPLPELHGGWRIDTAELRRDIEARFGAVVQKVTPSEVFLDHDVLRRLGHSATDIARFIGAYTLGDSVGEDRPGADRVPESRHDELVFAGAFSKDFIESLSSGAIDGLGAGSYPEGTFTVTSRP